MSTGPTTLPESRPAERDRRWFPRLRDARIRSKLALILVVPVAAVIALATVRLVAIGQEARDASMVHALTALSADISAVTQDLHNERMAAAVYLNAATPDPEPYNDRVRQTDEHVAAYHEERGRIGDVPEAVADRLQAIDNHLATLNGTRQGVLDRTQMPVSEAVLRYGIIITDLVAYGDVLGQVSGEGEVGDHLRALAALSRAKAAVAEEQAIAYAALSTHRITEEQFASFVATLTSQQEALLSFNRVATPQQRAMIESTVAGDAVVLANQVTTAVARSVNRATLITATDASRAIGAVHDLMRWTEVQFEVEVLMHAHHASSQVIQQALIESVAVVVVLVVAVVLAVVLARSLNRSLRRLREGALLAANRDLPEAVNRLRDLRSLGSGGVEEIVRQVRDPIRLPNRDEVGQVARVFNAVHREAVRIAAEQAALRTSVSAMFLNLARRSQTLVDRMIGELDRIERAEEDPKRLAQLFELDHLATRMRRNDENLLVLAGADSGQPRREDALLADALQAAQSEVELYNRIEFGTVDPDISIAANAVNDVVRLVAELLDNATRFSPPNTIVIADGRRIRDYVIIQVEDRGLGMTDEQLESLNRRLSEPPEVDIAAFRLMGLAVVGRLASRYGIRVELRHGLDGGTVAQVTLPSAIVVLPRREPLVTRPRQPLAVERGPAAPPPARWNQQPTPAAVMTEQWQNPPRQQQWEAPAPQRTAGYPAPVTVEPRTEPVSVSTTQMSPAVSPTAGLPAGPMAGGLTTTASRPAGGVPDALSAVTSSRREEPGESPIFREMEAVWFRAHGQDETQIVPTISAAGSAANTLDAMPTSRTSLPTRTPGQAVPAFSASPSRQNPSPAGMPAAAPTASAPMAAPTGFVPAAGPGRGSASPHQGSGQEPWRTAADEGWALASRAAQPPAGGTTRSGLPRRVPQAQLVPGGVEAAGGPDRTRRAPDEVRGLLSAYHRGVQRGRAAGGEQYGISKEASG